MGIHLGRRHQKRADHGRALFRPFKFCPPRDSKTPEAVRDEHDRPRCRPDREVKLVDPQCAVGRVPEAKFDTLEVITVLFPQGLPMVRSAIAQPRDGKKQRNFIVSDADHVRTFLKSD